MSCVYEHFDRDSPKCFAWVLSGSDPLSPEQHEQVLQRQREESQALSAAGHRRSKARRPVYRVPGPPPNLEGIDPLLLACAAPQPPVLVVNQQLAPGGSADLSAAVTPSPDQLKSSKLFDIPAILALKIHFILHLFSGQRRPGDFQDHLESTFSQRMSVLPIVVLSVDIVLDGKRGDLSNPDTVNLWTDLILLKRVAFVLGGPPCETWSVARFRRLTLVKVPDLSGALRSHGACLPCASQNASSLPLGMLS